MRKVKKHAVPFWLKVDIKGKTDCWEWLGGRYNRKHSHQYGCYSLFRQKKSIGAHVYAFETYYGVNAKGFVVRHKCDNPICVNPEHLELGTQGDNNRDTFSRNRNQKGNRKLSALQVIEIRNLKGQETAKSISARMRVARSTVLAVWCNQNLHRHANV